MVLDSLHPRKWSGAVLELPASNFSCQFPHSGLRGGSNRKHFVTPTLLTARIQGNAPCTVAVRPRGRQARKITVVYMLYHGNATRYHAAVVRHGLMIPALGRHITLSGELIILLKARQRQKLIQIPINKVNQI